MILFNGVGVLRQPVCATLLQQGLTVGSTAAAAVGVAAADMSLIQTCRSVARIATTVGYRSSVPIEAIKATSTTTNGCQGATAATHGAVGDWRPWLLADDAKGASRCTHWESLQHGRTDGWVRMEVKKANFGKHQRQMERDQEEIAAKEGKGASSATVHHRRVPSHGQQHCLASVWGTGRWQYPPAGVGVVSRVGRQDTHMASSLGCSCRLTESDSNTGDRCAIYGALTKLSQPQQHRPSVLSPKDSQRQQLHSSRHQVLVHSTRHLTSTSICWKMGDNDEVAKAQTAKPAEETIFGKMLKGIIPCKFIYEDEQCVAFDDINPTAPVHFLVIPRKTIAQLSTALDEDEKLIGHLMLVGNKIARDQKGLEADGYRVVINNGRHGCQSVYHLHLHFIGGKQLGWPPG